MHEFKFIAVNGTDKTSFPADSVLLVDEDGNTLELCPRRSDGEIRLYADDRLVIRPEAGNAATISSEKY